MSRRRLMTVLASTLAAGLVAMPATALPGLTDPIDEETEVLVTTVETVTTEVTGGTEVAGADEVEEEDDGGLLPTGEGELLEPLAPVTDPVEDALAPVLDPAEPVVDVADDVVDTVTDTLGLPDGGTDAAPTDGPKLPGGTVGTGSAPAGSPHTTAVEDDVTPSVPALDTYWAGPGVSRKATAAPRTVTTQQPQVATQQIEQPLTAPAAEQPTAAGPISDQTSSGLEAVLKVFAAFLVAATATMWQRAYAKSQIRS